MGVGVAARRRRGSLFWGYPACLICDSVPDMAHEAGMERVLAYVEG
jgi:hypothetical protein